MKKMGFVIMIALYLCSLGLYIFAPKGGLVNEGYLPHESYFYSECYNHNNVDLVYDQDIIKKVYGN